MITPIFRGTCHKGKIMPVNTIEWVNHLCLLEGKDCEFIARKKTKEKSNKQNKYFRAVVVDLIAKHCGYLNEKAYGVLQLKFFKFTDDNGMEYIKSTKLTEWNTVDWENKMSEIRQWASEFLNLYIPKPREVNMYE